MVDTTDKYILTTLLFLLLENDHFSWGFPQILPIFCHRAARNHLSSFRRSQQRKIDNLSPDSGPSTERGRVKEVGFDIAYRPAVLYALLSLSVLKCPRKAKEPS